MPGTDVDVLVIGGGAAGLSAALEASRTRSVALLVKGSLGDGATPLAQGGIAAAVGSGDSPLAHLEDTLAAGGVLCHPELVRSLVEAAPGMIDTLARLGATFDRDGAGALLLGREGGHRAARIVHAGGDRTGAEIGRALVAAVRRRQVEAVEHATVSDLLVDEAGSVVGARYLSIDGPPRTVTARAVVLATGGLGQLYSPTSNPPGATGDGLALGLRAGASVGDAEFVQFHPTVLWTEGAYDGQRPLVTEALRGAGAVLLDQAGRRVMEGVHPAGDLAPRDVVATRLHEVITESGQPCIHLDATHLGRERLARDFPTVVMSCRAAGIDPAREPVPVAPGAHYHCGGLMAGPSGLTDVPGLLAVGEVAWTGMHGANRLASNSLLEALVTGARAGELLARALPGPATGAAAPAPRAQTGAVTRPRLQHLMSTRAGMSRHQLGLEQLIDELSGGVPCSPASSAAAAELAHMRLAALTVARAALTRRESRGTHRRADHPRSDPRWQHSLVTHLGDGGHVTCTQTEELSS